MPATTAVCGMPLRVGHQHWLPQPAPLAASLSLALAQRHTAPHHSLPSPFPPCLLQPPNAFEYTFQLAMPLKSSTACLEVCTDCALPSPFSPDASWVYLNMDCSAGSMAAQWRTVHVHYSSPSIQLQSVLTGKCLHIDTSSALVAYSGEPAVSWRHCVHRA